MIAAAIQELQRRGVAGMSFTDVLAHSGAARGAIYHHFPDGKAQLAAEAAASYGTGVSGQLAALSGRTPAGVIRAFVEAVRPVVADSVYGGGCPVAAVTVGPDLDSVRLLDAAAAAFASWTAALTERLQTAGLGKRAAGDLAALAIAMLEGAHVMCRAARHLEPFESASRTLISAARSAQ
jgi:AcrR family transcriptional regulator